mmetsp:Transcript_6383/g.28827  ORF Transcript_6383/g.28827 Transcript_6383/m.28827 type:complete len:207 (+) Transcript_6383:870-1490(+)
MPPVRVARFPVEPLEHDLGAFAHRRHGRRHRHGRRRRDHRDVDVFFVHRGKLHEGLRRRVAVVPFRRGFRRGRVLVRPRGLVRQRGLVRPRDRRLVRPRDGSLVRPRFVHHSLRGVHLWFGRRRNAHSLVAHGVAFGEHGFHGGHGPLERRLRVEPRALEPVNLGRVGGARAFSFELDKFSRGGGHLGGGDAHLRGEHRGGILGWR